MPKPVHMIGAHGASIDQETGFLSIFELLEKVQVRPIPNIAVGQIIIVPWKPWRIFATWMREDNDASDQEYEFEFLIQRPGEEVPMSVGGGTFRFDQPVAAWFHRLSVRFDHPIPIPAAGILKFENRIRPVGGEHWQSQEYPVIIEMLAAEHPPEQAQQPPAPQQA